jgi:hypothetical protein
VQASPRQIYLRRQFHASVVANKTIPYKLADIGEGIAEAEVLQWYVHVPSAAPWFIDL